MHQLVAAAAEDGFGFLKLLRETPELMALPQTTGVTDPVIRWVRVVPGRCAANWPGTTYLRRRNATSSPVSSQKWEIKCLLKQLRQTTVFPFKAYSSVLEQKCQPFTIK